MSDAAERTISMSVNGRQYTAAAEPRMTLADFLRERLSLTGTHLGCEHGICGACTVVMDGRTVRSCLLFAVQADGHDVVTVESLAETDGPLHPLQQAFSEEHGLQCGFCTPGFLMTALELLERDPDPSEEDIRTSLSGNVCRCTGYVGIVRAVQLAAQRMRAG